MFELVQKYDWYMLTQIVLGFALNKYFSKYINKLNSVNTLVLFPIAPILSLVLYSLTRAKTKDYFMGYIFVLPMVFLVLMTGQLGASMHYVSIVITIIVYAFCSKQDGIGSVIVGLVIGAICVKVDNPISFMISCNLINKFILNKVLGLTNNKYVVTKEGYNNEGIFATVIGGLMEASLIGAPSDVPSNNKDMLDGMADILCIANLLVNGSMRGSTTVVVSSWPSAIIFFSIISIMYMYNTNLVYTDELDKVWPAKYNTNIIGCSKFELGVVVFSLIAGFNLTDYWMVGRLVLVIILSSFVRLKVTSSLFFSSNIAFS
jgi:hypothetical protein